jgi:hypothetical protein
MKLLFTLLICLPLTCFLPLQAQPTFNSNGQTIIITWDEALNDIVSGKFVADQYHNLVPDPTPGLGRLDSDGVHIQDDEPSSSLDQDGFDDLKDCQFQGISYGYCDLNENPGGVYAFYVDGTNNTTAWGVNPVSDAWSDPNDNGHMVIKYLNNTGGDINTINIGYELWSLNQQPNSTKVELYVTDQAEGGNVNYGFARASDDTPTTPDTYGWELSGYYGGTNQIEVTDLTIPNGEAFYLRFKIFDSYFIGGDRDVLAIDNISVTTNYNNVLPVEIEYFDASIYPDMNEVELTWKTVTETNNHYFVIERKSGNTSFEEIGRVGGNGTTNEPHSYKFVDFDPKVGINYYRLKQVDFDEHYKYSEIRVIESSAHSEVRKMKPIYPNPVQNGELYISFISKKAEVIKILVMDEYGRLRHSTSHSTTVGDNDLNVSLHYLISGQYYVLIVDENENMYHQSVIIHK